MAQNVFDLPDEKRMKGKIKEAIECLEGAIDVAMSDKETPWSDEKIDLSDRAQLAIRALNGKV